MDKLKGRYKSNGLWTSFKLADTNYNTGFPAPQRRKVIIKPIRFVLLPHGRVRRSSWRPRAERLSAHGALPPASEAVDLVKVGGSERTRAKLREEIVRGRVSQQDR